MRVCVFVLILANLLFFSWTQGYFGAPNNPDAQRIKLQMSPEKITVVGRGELPKDFKPGEKISKTEEKQVAQAAQVCILSGVMPAADLTQVETLLAAKLPAFKLLRSAALNPVSASEKRYWVFIPPQPTKAETEKKVSELKKLKITEYFVVQEEGENRHAISLGLFANKDGATERLEQLRAKGVRSAKTAEYNSKNVESGFEIHGPESQAESLRQAVAQAWPALKVSVCKSATS